MALLQKVLVLKTIKYDQALTAIRIPACAANRDAALEGATCVDNAHNNLRTVLFIQNERSRKLAQSHKKMK